MAIHLAELSEDHFCSLRGGKLLLGALQRPRQVGGPPRALDPPLVPPALLRKEGQPPTSAHPLTLGSQAGPREHWDPSTACGCRGIHLVLQAIFWPHPRPTPLGVPVQGLGLLAPSASAEPAQSRRAGGPASWQHRDPGPGWRRLLPSPSGPAPAPPPLEQVPPTVLFPAPCPATPPQPPHLDPLLLRPLLPPGSPLGFPSRSPSSDLPGYPASACRHPLAHGHSVPMLGLGSPGGPRAHAGVLVPRVGPGSGLPALLVPGCCSVPCTSMAVPLSRQLWPRSPERR